MRSGGILPWFEIKYRFPAVLFFFSLLLRWFSEVISRCFREHLTVIRLLCLLLRLQLQDRLRLQQFFFLWCSIPHLWYEILVALFLAWLTTAIILLASTKLSKLLGERGLIAIECLMWLILTAASVEMFIEGIKSVVTQSSWSRISSDCNFFLNFIM